MSVFFHFDFTLPLDRFELRIDCRSEVRTLGVFGKSGSGKTSFLQSVAGLRRAKGLIRLGERDLLNEEQKLNLRPEERRIGFVPQDHRLFPHLNVQKNLLCGTSRARRRLGMKTVESRSAEVIDVLELGPLLDRRIDTLSGGESQRVAMGRALCAMPEVLLLDEPLASLDSQLRERILPFLIRVQKEFDLPLIVVSHNPVELQILCEEVLVLAEGSIIASGKATEVLPQFAPQAIADPGSFESILRLRVISHESKTIRAHLLLSSGDGPQVTLPRQECKTGTLLHATLSANDIILARSTISGLSARNSLRGVIKRIDHQSWGAMIMVEIDPSTETQITVALTEDAIKELDLETGLAVHLIFKSSAVRVYG